jgi:SAM-dependent methyltransferase
VTDWQWDETLYAGSASHYVVGRMPYPPQLATALADALHLDGRGRLLDLGCGPGSLTVLLAPLFAEAVGVDPDAGMLAEGAKRDDRISWRRSTAEDIPLDWGPFRVVTFAQSFHWMDQVPVARRVRSMLEPGGACVHVGATTHRGMDGADPLPHPRPPHDAIDALVAEFLGPVRRAGAGTLPRGTRGDESVSFRTAGLTHQRRLEIPSEVMTRTEDQVVAAVFSLSSATPHLFGQRVGEFERKLRALLREVAPDRLFSERRREIALNIWVP